MIPHCEIHDPQQRGVYGVFMSGCDRCRKAAEARSRDTKARLARQSSASSPSVSLTSQPAMYTITKEFHFSASHVLFGLPDGHPCGRLHGHNYIVELELASDTLNEHGFVVDYRELESFAVYVEARCDHQHLNDQFDFQPTAENLACHFYEWASIQFPVVAVRVKETAKTCAEYRPTQSINLTNFNFTIVEPEATRLRKTLYRAPVSQLFLKPNRSID